MEIVPPVAGSLRFSGILLMERTHAHMWTSLPGVTEGAGVTPSYGTTPAPLPACKKREDGF
jgi:hypothetical protein